MEFALQICGKLCDLQTFEERQSPYFTSQRYIFLRTLLRFSEKNPAWKLSLQNSLLPLFPTPQNETSNNKPEDLLEIHRKKDSIIPSYFQFFSNGKLVARSRSVKITVESQAMLDAAGSPLPMAFEVNSKLLSISNEEWMVVDGIFSRLSRLDIGIREYIIKK